MVYDEIDSNAILAVVME